MVDGSGREQVALNGGLGNHRSGSRPVVTHSGNVHVSHAVLPLGALADLGDMPGARPHKGPDSFVSTCKIFET